eukprot:103566-Amphidinium_carterae.2
MAEQGGGGGQLLLNAMHPRHHIADIKSTCVWAQGGAQWARGTKHQPLLSFPQNQLGEDLSRLLDDVRRVVSVIQTKFSLDNAAFAMEVESH